MVVKCIAYSDIDSDYNGNEPTTEFVESLDKILLGVFGLEIKVI